MKKLFISAIMCLAALGSQAQFNYSFSHYTQAYVPLTGGISVNGSTIWDEESYKVPIGFSFGMDGTTIDSVSLLGGILAATDTQGVINGFLLIGADLVDRGHIGDTQSMSPIRYELSGMTPNRIFKLELFNAGFYDEYFLDTTAANDSINLQMWLYEGSNVVEIHYGNARVDNFDFYFTYDSSAVATGYIRGLDLDNGDIDKYYFVEGDPANPSIDSTSNMNALPELGLDTIPPSGTVYRFTPATLNVKDVNKSLASIKVFPTVCNDLLYIEHAEKDLVTYDIISANGSITNKHGQLKSGRHTINTGDLAAGSYMLRVSSGQVLKVMKFIKM